MAGKGESKTVATTPAMTPPATLPAINSPIPATKASMEDMATFVQPLAMIPAEGNSGGPVGATLRSADLPGRPTRGRDIQCPRSAPRSPSPLKIARSRARAHSPYGRPSKEAPAPSRPIVQQLFKDGAAIGPPASPQIARAAPVTQKSALGSTQGATPTWTPDTQKRSTAACPSPKKTRSQSSPAKPRDDMTSDGPTIADLT